MYYYQMSVYAALETNVFGRFQPNFQQTYRLGQYRYTGKIFKNLFILKRKREVYGPSCMRGLRPSWTGFGTKNQCQTQCLSNFIISDYHFDQFNEFWTNRYIWVNTPVLISFIFTAYTLLYIARWSSVFVWFHMLISTTS